MLSLSKHNEFVFSLIEAQFDLKSPQVQVDNFAAALCLARILAEFLQASEHSPPSKSSLQLVLK